FTFPAFFWPLLAYIFLSLISALLSVNQKVSFKDSKELLLFLIVPIVYLGFTEIKILKNANVALLISGYASSLYVIYTYFFETARPYLRATGFVGQKMTQGGLLMLFCCMALSIFLFSKEKIRFLWGAAFLVALFALILTQTRSSWIALVFCAVLILLFYKPKTLIIIPFALVLFYFISPKWIKERTLSIFSLKSKSDQPRIEYIKAGIEIIKDYPFFGTGPDTVDIVFQNPKYGLSELARKNVHLHNNILQTAAERGIPTLIAWLAFIFLTFLSLFKLLKNKDPTLHAFTVAALGALIGLFIAGLFEYNFADSEITALFLYMITIPFALDRIQGKSQESTT
ncbi:MAG: O-antigen ligase family protein, partial [Candidatus Aminicenantes bacterium]